MAKVEVTFVLICTQLNSSARPRQRKAPRIEQPGSTLHRASTICARDETNKVKECEVRI